jgi:hypothetical protein
MLNQIVDSLENSPISEEALKKALNFLLDTEYEDINDQEMAEAYRFFRQLYRRIKKVKLIQT